MTMSQFRPFVIGSYRWTVIGDQAPTPGMNGREAEVDFSGFALVVGLAVRFSIKARMAIGTGGEKT